ncbi:MAG: outer membrane protein assembly factor BamD [Ignavibacteria bacterium RBG_13_36_8]|nr:MAG: outer membrane protein assembly factor BamD [Ignavibacteria bacterium RBG_13_36_8]
MRTLIIILVLAIFWSCSSSVDTTQFSPEEHFNYALSLFQDESYELAVKEFQSILLQYPGSPVNDDSRYYLAMTYFNRGQFLLSGYEFSKLIRDIPTSPFVSTAQFMLAEAYYELSPPYALDQSYTKKAIEEYQAFIDFFPADEKVEEAERKIKEMTNKLALKDYNSGLIYEKMEYYSAALKYYSQVSDMYHDTEYGPLALYKKVMIEVDRNKKTDALSDISTFLNRYPDHQYIGELKNIEQALLN